MRTASQVLITFLFNAGWQVLLIAAVAALGDRLLRRVDPRYRHALWVIALVLSLVLPLLSTSATLTRRSDGPPPVAEKVLVPVVVTRISSIEGDEIKAAETEPPVPTVTTQSPPRASLFPIKLGPWVAGSVIAIYLLSVLYAFARLLQAWRRTRRIVRAAFVFELPNSLEAILQKCSRAIITRNVRILGSNIPVPITVGIFRPLIILPVPLLGDVDEDVLTSAVGHELVHVARYDYVANLIYELICLPVWFHPAALLIRRRIRQTRELCCDQRMAEKLLKPEIYARSLLRLIGAAPPLSRFAADTTIGIAESDNLEVRIMSLLKTKRISRRRQAALLLTVTLLLAAPCVAASSFALNFEINRAEPQEPIQKQQLELKKHEQLRAELQQRVQELKEQERLATAPERAEIEARVREVQRNLEEQEKLMQQYRQQSGSQSEADARLSEVRRKLIEHARLLEEYQQKEAAKSSRVPEAQTTLAELLAKYPDAKITRQGQILDDQKHLEELQAKLASLQQTRNARVIHRVEPKYPDDARDKKITGSVVVTLTVDHQGLPQNIKVKRSLYPSMDQAAIEAAGQMRFEPAMKEGQPASQTLLVEFYFSLQSKHVEVMGQGESKGEAKGEGYGTAEYGSAVYGGVVRDVRRRKDQEAAGQDDRARRQAELTQAAVISMDRAIQIATSKYPGKVLACSLGRDKDGPVFYHLVMINTEGDKRTVKYIWLSAIDGTIIKTEDEKQAASVSGGVLNGKAVFLPRPEYPEIARAARAAGSVTVQVTIDEQGNVISARAVSGHPLLQAAAVSAARNARFTPTYLEGQPVKVSGQLVYDFMVE